MSLGDCFEADNREVYKLTPGVVDAVDGYSGDTLRAKHLDLDYRNTKLGAALRVLEGEGYLEPVQLRGRRPNLYAKTGRSFDGIRRSAEDLFLQRIDEAFTENHSDSILSDFRDNGIYVLEKGDRRELGVLRPDYCESTLDFLSTLNIIGDSEGRRVLAPDTDIRFVERYLEGF